MFTLKCLEGSHLNGAKNLKLMLHCISMLTSTWVSCHKKFQNNAHYCKPCYLQHTTEKCFSPSTLKLPTDSIKMSNEEITSEYFLYNFVNVYTSCLRAPLC